MKIYHEGFDAAKVEYVQVKAYEGWTYLCEFPDEWLDSYPGVQQAVRCIKVR